MNYSRLRRQWLSTIQKPQFNEIVGALTTEKKYNFLRSPATQISYGQFCYYIQQFCQCYFGTTAVDILDWGCGHGQTAVLLNDLGLHVQAADIDIGNNDRRPLLSLRPINFTLLHHPFELPFPDESFDAVVSFGVLEHVPNEAASLLEIHRILKPGGIFFCFNLPYFYSWGQRFVHLRGHYYHDRLYKESYIKRILPQYGYNLLDLWHLMLFPKISINYGRFSPAMEQLDQFLTNYTPLRYLATSLNFTACKTNL